MGVRQIQIYQDLTRESKPVVSTSGNGGCCAIFTRISAFGTYAKRGKSMDVRFDGYDFPEAPDLFESKLIQALVPGTSFVDSSKGAVGAQIHVPYHDVPADQVSCVLRLAKCWFGGYYQVAYANVRNLPLSAPDKAALAVIIGGFEADSDGGVSFTGGRICDVKNFGSFNSGSLWTPSSVFAVLNGQIKPGKQAPFQQDGYFKAGWVYGYVDTDRSLSSWEKEAVNLYTLDDEPSANYPVIIRGEEGELHLSPRDPVGNLNKLNKWLKDNGKTWEDVVDSGNSQGATQASAMELPVASEGGAEQSSTVVPSTGPQVSASASSSAGQSAQQSSEIDWSAAPPGTMRATPASQTITMRGPVWLKQSRATGLYYWRHHGMAQWVRYNDQELGAERYARAVRKPRTPTISQEVRERWAQAPEGATHFSFYPHIGSRWLREDGEVHYFWMWYSWVRYFGPEENYIHHFTNSERRPRGL